MKLTEAQRRHLAEMAVGHEAWTISGRTAAAFWFSDPRTTAGYVKDRNPNMATLHVLERAKLIENYQSDYTGGKYRITPAGRSILDGGRDG